jgi:hypothetical protein
MVRQLAWFVAVDARINALGVRRDVLINGSEEDGLYDGSKEAVACCSPAWCVRGRWLGGGCCYGLLEAYPPAFTRGLLANLIVVGWLISSLLIETKAELIKL